MQEKSLKGPFKKISCYHCDEIIAGAIYFNDTDQKHSYPFCCRGCQSVFNLLGQNGLEDYYEIKNTSSFALNSKKAVSQSQSYSYLDDAKFQEQFVEKSEKSQSIKLYLEGVHCLACLWLLEKLPEIIPECLHTKLDMGKSLLFLEIEHSHKFSTVVEKIHSLGYPSTPIKNTREISKLKQKELRHDYLRIGIAAASMGNIMLASLSIYSGAGEHWIKIFNYLGFIFILPVVFFSSIPFYKSAWSGLKHKKINLDIPIAFAIITIFAHGLMSQLLGLGENYFDTLATLVFLLLSARAFVKKLTQNNFEAKDFSHFHITDSTLKINPETQDETEILATHIQIDDQIKILPGKMIPCDGIILSGTSSLNTSLLTGESASVQVGPGDFIYSGTQNIENSIFVKVQKIAGETRLGQILDKIQIDQTRGKMPFATTSDKLAQYFIIIIFMLALSVIFFFAFQNDIATGLYRAFTLIIITCPCALGLATPLALSSSLALALKRKVLIKNEWALEKLAKIDTIIADKTGTLTYGELKIIKCNIHDESLPTHKILSIVLSLEDHSHHPIAKALRSYIQDQSLHQCQILPHSNFQETLGQGLSAQFEEKTYTLKKLLETDQLKYCLDFHKMVELNTFVGLYQDRRLIVSFVLQDKIREETPHVIKKLQARKLKTFILSGDNSSSVLSCAKQIHIPCVNALSTQSPENKLKFIKKYPRALMIGDGANDSLALGHAYLGMAVSGSVEMGLHVCDIYCSKPGLNELPFILDLSKETITLILRNLKLSLVYNFVGIILALTGSISPLMAAILMPISSLSVIGSTVWGTKKLRKLKKCTES